ncbi:MAG: two-component system OmpR family response regulator, partial [Bacteroidia bacterium]
MRILIVEDESRIADFLSRGLRAEGHFCVIAQDGEEGLSLASEGDFELILLDLMLPKMHGHEVCQQLRMNRINTPLMILTAMDSTDDIVAGLRLGADDYMTKPFSFEELLARIESVKRRTSSRKEEDPR